VGEGEVAVAPFRLGLRDEVGFCVAGALRPDFPTRVEMLLLTVVSNQAVMGLQDARRLNDKKRHAEELELRLAQRAEELTRANAELRRQISERKRAESKTLAVKEELSAELTAMRKLYPSPDGGLITFQGYITRRKQMEEELRRTQAELTHVTRMTTMGELAASIAHEINQPLGAIVNNGNACLRLVTNSSRGQDSLREILSDIIHDANRASAIIARIRELTRKAPSARTSLQLAAVVADVLALAHRELADRQIAVYNELTENLPSVSGNRVQLQQVLLNLVMNATDAMQTVPDERKVMTIAGKRGTLGDRPAVLITVHDLGEGFRVKEPEHLFDAFYTTKTQGLGMGLRISRSIVEAHGGRLWGIPNEGPGVTFSCLLPAQDQEG
jgi:C4-dicarboxylate-specific signal transduction histidine kinase